MNRLNYSDFLTRKMSAKSWDGIDHPMLEYGLFPHQNDLTEWALRRGKSAIFAATGLGKTRIELAWANEIHRHTGMDGLILAPLAVTEQTVEEGEKIGVSINHAKNNSHVKTGITITNYDRLHLFDCSQFGFVVLDESSIIKSFTSSTLKTLLDKFKNTSYKMAASATPSPNDFTELGNHAQLLDVCSRQEMLSEFFINDQTETQKWRIKGHAKDLFWKWVAEWAALIQKPSDLGYDDTQYNLPPLNIISHEVEMENTDDFDLFGRIATTLHEQRHVKRESLEDRAKACADMVNARDDIWLVWCELNDEGDLLEKLIPGSVQIKGSNESEYKERELLNFAKGKTRVLISKPKICGFGLNFQVCHNMAFTSVSNSFESYYQAVRRCWRFGQKHPVNVYVFYSNYEGHVMSNLKRKEYDNNEMIESLSAQTKHFIYKNIKGCHTQSNEYQSDKRITFPSFYG